MNPIITEKEAPLDNKWAINRPKKLRRLSMHLSQLYECSSFHIVFDNFFGNLRMLKRRPCSAVGGLGENVLEAIYQAQELRILFMFVAGKGEKLIFHINCRSWSRTNQAGVESQITGQRDWSSRLLSNWIWFVLEKQLFGFIFVLVFEIVFMWVTLIVFLKSTGFV